MKIDTIILIQIEDLNLFQNNYENNKKNYKTSKYLNKYEKTKVLSERVQQLANNSKPLIPNPQNYNDIYSIAIEELRQKNTFYY